MMSMQQGRLVSLNYSSIALIQALSGFFSMDLSSTQPGKDMVTTTSELNIVGSLQFVVPLQMLDSFRSIIESVRNLERGNIFQLESPEEKCAAIDEEAKPAKNKPFRRALF